MLTVDNVTKLDELVESKGAEIRIREMSKARFSDYVDYRGVTVFLFGVLGVFTIGLIFLFAHIWLRIKETEVRVLNLLGYGHIRRKVQAEYSAVWLAAFLLSLGKFIDKVPFHGIILSLTPKTVKKSQKP